MKRNIDIYNNESTTITIRCPKKVKEQLKEKSQEREQSLSCYLLDTGIAGLESRRNKKKKEVSSLVELTQSINDLEIYLKAENLDSNSNLQEKMDNIMKGIKKLWEI